MNVSWEKQGQFMADLGKVVVELGKLAIHVDENASNSIQVQAVCWFDYYGVDLFEEQPYRALTMQFIEDEIFHGVGWEIDIECVCVVRDVGLQFFVIAIFSFYLKGFLVVVSHVKVFELCVSTSRLVKHLCWRVFCELNVFIAFLSH